MKLSDWTFAAKHAIRKSSREQQKVWSNYFDKLEKQSPSDNLGHPERPTVILIPWITRSAWVMKQIWDRLWEILNVAYIEINAEDWEKPEWLNHIDTIISNKIRELPWSHPIILLGHSTGWGSAVRVWLSSPRVSHIYQLATPNNGTPFYYHPSVRKLQSAKDMNNGAYKWAKWTNNPIVTTFIAKDDQLVSPDSQSSKYLPERLQTTDTTIEWVNHYSIITDPESINTIYTKVRNTHI